MLDEPEVPPQALSPGLKHPGRMSRQPTPIPQPEPKPYQYGQVGRPPSQMSWASSPPSSPPPTSAPTAPESSHHSHNQSLSVLTNCTPPPSAYGHAASPGLGSGAWTPPPGVSTALTPGLSIPSSSRPPTPGTGASLTHQHGRQSWPRIGGSDDSHDEFGVMLNRPLSERRPSRLSLTLANWNPETDHESDSGEAGGR